jgi:DNA-binding NtrC family response regulator
MARGHDRVLCVDDEPNVLSAMARHLRRHFDVTTAQGGAAALEILLGAPPFAVIVSDLRMPGMDGVSFFSRAHAMWPHTVRVLLTGEGDLDAAVRAVNQGQIFRFLKKPCPPEVLLPALREAVEEHQRKSSELRLPGTAMLKAVPLSGLTDGMVFVDDLRARDGTLRAHRGQAVTRDFLEGLPGWREECEAGLVQMLIPMDLPRRG